MADTVRALQSTSRKIKTQLDQLADMARDRNLIELRSTKVSGWSVGEQIEHLRRSDLTIIGAIESLQADDPREGSPTLAGRAVLGLGFIPRGVGKAPGATQPLELDGEALSSQVKDVKRAFTGLEESFERLAGCKGTIRHPALGHFSAEQMLRFAEIHHRHHMKIIRDIRGREVAKS